MSNHAAIAEAVRADTLNDVPAAPGTAGPAADSGPAPATGTAGPPAEILVADLLVEEVSIDGMCGVY